MLAVALNYIGETEEQNLGYMLLKYFAGFKLVKLSPSKIVKEGRLQICQPEGYGDLQKDIQQYQDPAGIFLELRGPRDKLQRTVRYMFFFDEEKKYSKVVLEGCDGIADFPWALQLVLVELPASGWGRKTPWIREADMIVINGTESEESRGLIAKVKEVCPNIPVYTEKVREGFSPELQENLEILFAAYMEKRKRIKDLLELQYPEQEISCALANSTAGKLGVSSFLVGSVCDELGYSITRCGLGCF